MGKPISEMTAAEIRDRLAELRATEGARMARDFDAELRAVIRRGGDVDELETAQLEMERQVRRARVERTALEQELPVAVKREGGLQQAALSEHHKALEATARACADRVAAAWGEMENAIKGWAAVQEEADNLTRTALQIEQKTGAPMPTLGTFQSSRLASIYAKGNEAIRTMSITAEVPMSLSQRLHGVAID